MLCHELSCHKGRLLLCVLVLEDAGCNCYAVPGVDQVVSHESGHFADDGHKALLGHLHHLLRVSDALEAPHCSVHSFRLLLISKGGARQPRLKLYNATMLASIGTWRITQMSDIRNFLANYFLELRQDGACRTSVPRRSYIRAGERARILDTQSVAPRGPGGQGDPLQMRDFSHRGACAKSLEEE